MKQISLTKNRFTLVDDEDYDFLMQWSWHVNDGRYIKRTENYYKPCGKRTTRAIYLHRIVNDTPEDLVTDHIDGDILNNQKSNLRSCTNSQNQMNRKPIAFSSKYKGVHWYKRGKKWKATISINGKSKSLGSFLCEKEAANSYNKAAIEYFGEFARLNDIIE